ncbi:MAG: AAA family ATPase [Myxococcales bacterium]|nr:AAA family ATPase [Myxococcales bacterium]
MPATVNRLRAKGFKSIASVDLELRPLNVLIGANGAGKSNFVGLFALLGQLVEGKLQSCIKAQGGADAILTNGLKRTQHLEIDVSFARDEYKARLAGEADGSLHFEHESARWHRTPGLAPFVVDLGAGHTESALLATERKIAAIALHRMREWRVFHFHDTSAFASVKLAGSLHDNKALRADAGNLAAVLYKLQKTKPKDYRQIVETIRQVAPFFDDFSLEPDRLSADEQIRLEWAAVGTDAYFNASSLSDGTLRFMCLATLLLQPEPPSVILIDEPELGLHPYAINVLAALLETASHHSQIIVSTQSVTLVNQLVPEDLIVVDREPHGSTFRRPNEAELAAWLEDYALDELWEKNLLGGRPK